MVSSEVVEYVKEQLRAGYSPAEIRAALQMQEWTEEEISEAFRLAGGPLPGAAPAVYPPVKLKKGRNVAFAISLAGGLLIFIFGLETVLSFPLISSSLVEAGLVMGFFGFFEALLVSNILIGSATLALAVGIIAGSLVSSREGKGRAGGLLVAVFSALALAGFNGFLLSLGSILGIIGGILNIWRGS
jgi:hypothetical protein